MKDEDNLIFEITNFIEAVQFRYSEDLKSIPMLALQGVLDPDDLMLLIEIIEGDQGSVH